MRNVVTTILFLLAVQASFGQVIETDTVPKSRMWVPTTFRIGVEVINPIAAAIVDERSGFELQAEFDVNKFLIVTEWGRTSYKLNEDSVYDYTSTGNFLRLGIDANLIPYDRQGSIITIGLRYGAAEFKDEIDGVFVPDYWDSTSVVASNGFVGARWFELVVGMKARVWKQLHMGYSLRLKVSPDYVNEQNFAVDPFHIPGYGRADQEFIWAVSYYVAWNFPFRQKYLKKRKYN